MSNFITRLILPATFFLLFLLSITGIGQTSTGSISGLATDSNGAVIPNLKVLFVALAGGQDRQALTDAQGEFSIKDVVPGVYSVDVKFFGMRYVDSRIVVEAGKDTRVNIIATYEANCPVRAKGKSLTISDSDRKEIVSYLLRNSRTAISAENRRRGSADSTKIILSLATIKAEWVDPDLAKNLILLSEQEIYDRADQKGDYLHLSFSDWHVGEECVLVTINNSWAVAKNSPYVYLSGGGETFLFKKQDGKWHGDKLGGWIS